MTLYIKKIMTLYKKLTQKNHVGPIKIIIKLVFLINR